MREQSENRFEAAEGARAQAGMYSFLANLFNQRPNLEFVKRLRELGPDGFSFDVGQGEISAEVKHGLQEMASFIDETQGWSEDKVEQELAVDWTRLFRGVSPGYGPPPPYEGVYSEGVGSPADVLQAIVQVYHKYSVDVDEKAANRPDYFGIELDFLRHLSESEARAWEEEDEQKALGYQTAQQEFLSNHLGKWAGKFCERALEEAKTEFYRGFLRLTQSVLKEQMERSI